ncbi:MAG: CHAT domain-containing protein [Candidatus Krumholzibacteriia bacterium]
MKRDPGIPRVCELRLLSAVFAASLLAAALLVAGLGGSGFAAEPEALARIDALMTSGDFAGALAAAETAVLDFAAAGDVRSQATAELRVSDSLYYLGRREETLAPLERALSLYESISDLEGIGRTYYSMAYYYERTEPGRMIELLEVGRGFAERAGDPKLIMNTANATGVALWNLGRYEEASLAFERSIAIARESGDGPALASANQNLGLIHLHQGYCLEALDHFTEALAELENAGNSHGVAVVLGNMGNAYLDRRDLEAALDCYRRSLDLHRRNGYLRGIGVQLGNLASIQEYFGEAWEAAASHRQAAAIARRTGDGRGEIRDLTALGRLAQAEGRPDSARIFLNQALTAARTIGDPDLIAPPLKNLAILDFAEGDTLSGLTRLGEARTEATRNGNDFQLGFIAALEGQVLAAAGRPDSAAAAFTRAIDLHETTRTRTNVFQWRSQLARQHLRMGRTADADREFRAALEDVDELDALIATGDFRIQLFTEVQDVFRDYAAWLLEKDRIAEAWQVIERGRARDLGFRLLQDRTAIEIPATEKAALDRISAFQRRLREQSLEDDERLELQQMITEAEIEFDRTRWRPRNALPGRRTASPLPPPPGTLAVLYALNGDTLLVLSASGDDLKRRAVPGAAALMERCSLYRDLASDPRSGDRLDPAARALFTALLGPEFGDVPPVRLVLSPDGELWNLPFATLRGPDGRYLCESTFISLAPTLGIAADLADLPPPAGRGILAVAGSTFDGSPDGGAALGALPAAVIEAERVVGLDRAAVLLADVGEDRLKDEDLRRFQLLHFATHTLADPLHANRAGIVLGTGAGEDGYLQAREIYRLPLDAGLCVVSGCRSGDGGTAAGEGLLGLSHAFLSAGSRSVVLSRWDIPDEGAAFFMDAFYDALPGATAEEALAAAQRTCLTSGRWSHPAWWGAYFVAGDGGRSLRLDGGPRSLRLPAFALGGAALLLLGAILVRRR